MTFTVSWTVNICSGGSEVRYFIVKNIHPRLLFYAALRQNVNLGCQQNFKCSCGTNYLSIIFLFITF
jgi:hypothetical protein